MPSICYAQKEGDFYEEEKQELEVSTILKFAPLSLLDIYSSIQFAVEQKIGKKASAQFEAGYIFPININEGAEDRKYENLQGLRFRSELRYYLVLSKDKTGGLYLAPEVLFIDLNYDVKQVAKIYFPEGNGASYYKQYEYEVDKNIFGYHAKVGYQEVSGRFVLDLYGGLGGRNATISSGKFVEEGVRFVDNRRAWDFFPSEKESGSYHKPSVSLGFKIGYLIK